MVSGLKAEVITSIGKNIREHRKNHGLTQEKLAEEANCSEKHLSAVENGRLDNVSIGYLIDIATALDIDYMELLKP
ncbi:MAG: hypothetical protein CSA54_02565 [Gammaproteobacteria bacterium]|nr:MAG: hypothetical protein CSA54_02565 [Gammaproteobacteria bacterium]